MKKINKLGFMSLLGILGILGIITGHKEYIGFIGFFGYLGFFKVIPDELFKKNINTSASIGFFIGIAVTFIFIAISMFIDKIATSSLNSMSFAFGFAASILSFSAISVYLLFKEQRGSK